MAIVTTKNVVYDTVGRFYYLTVIGAEEETGHILESFWHNAQLRLKKQGKALKRWLTSNPYNAENDTKRRPIDLFEYRVFLNEKDEAQQIYDMLVEFAEWSYENTGDRAIYDNEESVPKSVKEIAYPSKLKLVGNSVGSVPDDEYRVGY